MCLMQVPRFLQLSSRKERKMNLILPLDNSLPGRLRTALIPQVANPREALPDMGQGALNAIAALFSCEDGRSGPLLQRSPASPHHQRGRGNHRGPCRAVL